MLRSRIIFKAAFTRACTDQIRKIPIYLVHSNSS
jgi:hypothetical protein